MAVVDDILLVAFLSFISIFNVLVERRGILFLLLLHALFLIAADILHRAP